MNNPTHSLSGKSTILTRMWNQFIHSITNTSSLGAYFEPLIQVLWPQWTTAAFRSRVRSIRSEVEGMFTLEIRPPRTWTSNFQAGQFIEITVEHCGARITRCFSISSSPEYYKKHGLIEVSIRIQEKGRITPWMYEQLKEGSIINISEPKGEFILEKSSKPILMIAGGSGITPFRSMLQSCAVNTLPVTLFYYARNDQQFAFKQEFIQLSNKFKHINIHFIDTEKEGVFSLNHLKEKCPDFLDYQVYICGPSPMILSAKRTLLEADATHINYEFFGPEPLELDNIEAQGLVKFNRSNIVANRNDDDTKSLLEVAEQQGLKPVAGCRKGVCHQCICKKQSGVVFNTIAKTYSDTGQQDIQLCISVPIGDVVLDL